MGARATLRQTLTRALTLLASESPRAARELAELAPASSSIEVRGDEGFAIQRQGSTLAVVEAQAAPVVRIAVSESGLRALSGGHLTLLEAIRAEELDAHGRVEDLVAAEAALRRFLEAAARSQEMGVLLDEWRTSNEP